MRGREVESLRSCERGEWVKLCNEKAKRLCVLCIFFFLSASASLRLNNKAKRLCTACEAFTFGLGLKWRDGESGRKGELESWRIGELESARA